MNLNAPEHQPLLAEDATVVRFASDKKFSNTNSTITGSLNQRKELICPLSSPLL
jgi:hypothetical protein